VAPSPIVACVGGIENIAQTASMAFKRAGSPLYFVGRPEERTGGSVYADLLGITNAMLPAISYDRVEREIALLLAAYAGNLVLAAHDISDGGALVAVAKMAFATAGGARIGMRLDESPLDGREGVAAFTETCGFIVEVTDAPAFEALAKTHGAGAMRIGETSAPFTFAFAGNIERSLDDLYETWSAPLRDFYAPAAVAGAA
jgi:phosphoribosylformylglycinamidine synthase